MALWTVSAHLMPVCMERWLYRVGASRGSYNPSMPAMNRRVFLSVATVAALAKALPAAYLSDFKLGVTTDEIDDDLLTAIEFLKRFGLEYAEIRNLWGKYNTSQPVEKIRHARTLLDQHSIKTCILDTSFFKVPLPPESAEGNRALDKQWAVLDRAMERATILGTGKIRTFAFTYPRNGQADPSHYPRIYELLREAARRAKAGNFRLALENVGRSYVSTASELAAALKAVQDDSFGAIWEPNNSARSGGRSFPEGYHMIDTARIFHIHLRDYCRVASGKYEWCGVSEGEFDHVGHFSALLKDGYKETLSLETHYRRDGSKMKASEFSMRGLLKAIERA